MTCIGYWLVKFGNGNEMYLVSHQFAAWAFVHGFDVRLRSATVREVK
jgi:hypothetical protein